MTDPGAKIMTKIVVLQHVPYEILGTMNPLFKQQGMRIKYVNFGRHPHAEPSLRRADALVILGGPMNVDMIEEHPYLQTEIKLIQRAMEKQIPILGICLGAQLVAKAAGARVSKNPQKEIGWYDVSLTEEGVKDPLLMVFNKTEKIFQWHGDTFDLPKNSVHLASSAACSNQAFRIGDNIYGFQFHLEVDQPMIERWLNVPAHIEEMVASEGKINPEKIRQETPLYIARAERLSNQTFIAFGKLIGHRGKQKRLGAA